MERTGLWDWLIENGRIVDGSGSPWMEGDIALAGDRIAAVGHLTAAEATRRLDAQGLFIAPGFIDSHTHSEAYALADPDGAEAKVAQGVTTDIMGLCGLSAFPVADGRLAELRAYMGGALGGTSLPWTWRDYAGMVEQAPADSWLLDAGSMVGHGSVRLAVMGTAQRSPTPQELVEIQRLVAQALDQGALGVSFGLLYPPGCFAGRQELIAVAEVAAGRGRPCAVHLRDEGDHLISSVEEMLDVARASGCRLVLSHLKAAGEANFGNVERVLAMVTQARQKGIDVRADAYPYLAGCPWITALLPPWASDGGIEAMLDRLRDRAVRARIGTELTQSTEWENLVRIAGWDGITLLGYPPDPRLEGQTLAQLAQEWSQPPSEALMDVILASAGEATVAVFDLNEEDVETAISHPLTMIASDGGPSPGLEHPRLRGTFPRVLSHYVRERGALRLEEAVRKMTSYVAQTFNLSDRGLISPGLRADLVLFDPDTIVDRATYHQPERGPAGIRAVFVAGQPVVRDGELTGRRPGRPVMAG